MTCDNWHDTFFSEVSFCVFHLFCFVRCYSLPVPHPIPRSLSSFLIVLHWGFFPRVFNTVLEVKHAVLFQQLLLNLNSHMNLKGHLCLGSDSSLYEPSVLFTSSFCTAFLSDDFPMSHNLFTLLFMCTTLLFPLLVTASGHCRNWYFQVGQQRPFTFLAALAALWSLPLPVQWRNY